MARFWRQAKVAESLGVSVQAVSQWERNETEPTPDNYAALARLFDVTVEWIKTGEVQEEFTPLLAEEFTPLLAPEPPEPKRDESAASAPGDGDRDLPPPAVLEFDLRTGASHGRGYAAAAAEIAADSSKTFPARLVRAEWRFPENWLGGEMRLAAGTTDILPVDGASMLPDLAPGDRVIVDRSNRDPKQDAIFAVKDGDSVIIKHVHLVRGSHPPRIICTSSNPRYEPFELILDGEQAEIIGRIAGRISKL